MKAKEIVQWDIDEASYVGDGDDGVYYQVGEKTWGPRKHRGFYVTCLVDTETGAYTGEIMPEDGPYETEEAATQAGKDCAYEWCINNEVDPEGHPLNLFSELMFNIKYTFGMAEFEKLLANPEFARFMTLEESELTPELEQDLREKIDFLQWQWKPIAEQLQQIQKEPTKPDPTK